MADFSDVDRTNTPNFDANVSINDWIDLVPTIFRSRPQSFGIEVARRF